MNSYRKCRAKSGPASCRNPNYPEKRQQVNRNSLSLISHKNTPPVSVNEYKNGASVLLKKTWTEADTVLFKAQSGSKLYGYANAESDDDYIIVTPTVRTKKIINAHQSIVGKKDTLVIDFSSFVLMAEKGIPQILEVMYSRKDHSPFFEEYRNSWYSAGGTVINRYLRTIKNFALTASETVKGESYDDYKKFKRRRHAFRLTQNLNDILKYGRFNPTLTQEQVEKFTVYAKLKADDYIEQLRNESFYDFMNTTKD